MNKILAFVILYNALLLLGITYVYYDASQYSGNHWVLFGTKLEQFLLQWRVEVIWLINIPNIAFIIYSALTKKYVSMAALSVVAAAQIVLLHFVSKLVLD